jgi:hypothetical protein
LVAEHREQQWLSRSSNTRRSAARGQFLGQFCFQTSMSAADGGYIHISTLQTICVHMVFTLKRCRAVGHSYAAVILLSQLVMHF